LKEPFRPSNTGIVRQESEFDDYHDLSRLSLTQVEIGDLVQDFTKDMALLDMEEE